MKDTASIRVEMSDGLAILNFAQAARGNPIDGPFTSDFTDVFLDLWNEPGLRAVLLRADGPNFSLGGDLKAFYPVRTELAPLVRAWTGNLHMGLQRAWHLPVPIVVAVQGFAMGGGVGVLAGCDVVMAAESAKFGSAFAQLGFSCDSGSSATLTARMGTARARRFVLLAEMLKAPDALQAGLVDMVVPDDQLQEQALALARKLASGPTRAYAEIKRLFLQAGSAQLEAQLEDEAQSLARMAATVDAREGLTSFMEKRAPIFRGE